ncbi:MAG: DUF6787 family protein [Candidatus Eremiobacterota bacterium]
MERLKARWGITSNFQVAVILVVFALTGTTAVYVKKPILAWLGVTPHTPGWLRVTATLVVVLGVYQVLLLAYGALLGQFPFFWAFEKRMLGRLTGRR